VRYHVVVLRIVALASVVLIACGDDAGPGDGGDGGVDSTMPDDGVADPMPPAPPVLTPCPMGTVETPRAGAPTECWPIAEPACTGDEVRFFGDTACALPGSACAGDFPAAPAGGGVYVLAGSTGGDGTESAPLGTIAAGIAAAGRGGTVLVGRGTYEEIIFVDRDVEIRGLCPSETILTTATPDTVNGVVNVTAGSVTLVGLSVRAPARGGITVTTRSEATLRDVIVDGASSFGVYFDLQATGTVDGLVVRNVDSALDGRFGDGLVVDTGAVVTASRVVVERARATGVNVLGTGSLTIDHLTVRDMMPSGVGIGGRALSIKAESTLTADSVFIERVREVAIEVRDIGTSATLSQVVVDDTQLHVDGERGRAFTNFDGAATTIRGMVVRGVGDSGLLLAGGTVDVEDLVVRDVAGQEDGNFGRFLEVGRGAVLTGRRIHCEEARDMGVAVNGEGTSAVLEDLFLSGMRGRVSDGLYGRGINVQQGARLEVRRVALVDVRNVGVFVDAATLSGEDLDVREVAPAEGTRRGRGLNLQLGAEVTLSRTRVEDAYDLGVFAAATGTTAGFTDLTLSRVTAPPCPSGEDCGVDIGGLGVGVYQNAAVTVDRIDLSGATLCGLHIAEAGELDVMDGRITGNRIGACIQVDGYDLSRIESPAYEDNVTNLESTSLPVPTSDVGLE
jgi:hypothetical protein